MDPSHSENPTAPPLKRSRDASRYADWEDQPAVHAFLAHTETREKERASIIPYFASSIAAQPLSPWFPVDGLPASYAMVR